MVTVVVARVIGRVFEIGLASWRCILLIGGDVVRHIALVGRAEFGGLLILRWAITRRGAVHVEIAVGLIKWRRGKRSRIDLGNQRLDVA